MTGWLWTENMAEGARAVFKRERDDNVACLLQILVGRAFLFLFLSYHNDAIRYGMALPANSSLAGSRVSRPPHSANHHWNRNPRYSPYFIFRSAKARMNIHNPSVLFSTADSIDQSSVTRSPPNVRSYLRMIHRKFLFVVPFTT